MTNENRVQLLLKRRAYLRRKVHLEETLLMGWYTEVTDAIRIQNQLVQINRRIAVVDKQIDELNKYEFKENKHEI